MDDHYATLKVPVSADADQIRTSYHRLALEKHPDRAIGDKAAATLDFQRLHHAYETLSDSHRRALYDKGRASAELRQESCTESVYTQPQFREPISQFVAVSILKRKSWWRRLRDRDLQKEWEWVKVDEHRYRARQKKKQDKARKRAQQKQQDECKTQ